MAGQLTLAPNTHVEICVVEPHTSIHIYICGGANFDDGFPESRTRVRTGQIAINYTVLTSTVHTHVTGTDCAVSVLTNA